MDCVGLCGGGVFGVIMLILIGKFDCYLCDVVFEIIDVVVVEFFDVVVECIEIVEFFI